MFNKIGFPFPAGAPKEYRSSRIYPFLDTLYLNQSGFL